MPSQFKYRARRAAPLMWGIFTFLTLVSIACAIYFDQLNNQRFRLAQRASTADELGILRAELEGNLISNLQVVQGLAATINANPRLDQQTFTRYAAPLINGHAQLRNIGAAPDMVIRYIYPLEGNRAAIGLDYRNEPNQWQEAALARESGEMVVAGPLTLKQGGEALIGRIPVYLYDEAGNKTSFWGLISAVIDLEAYYRDSGLSSEGELTVALRKKIGQEWQTFYGNPDTFIANPVTASIRLPNGQWEIAATPAGGWQTTADNATAMRTIMIVVLVLILLPSGVVIHLNRQRQDKDVRLQALFDFSPLGIALVDPASGRIRDANHAFCTMLERPRTAIIDSNISALVAEDHDEMLRAVKHQLTNTGAFGPAEINLLLPDGTPLEVTTTGVQIRDSNGNSFNWCILEDITDRKLAERALSENKKQLELVIDSTAVGIWDWNIQTGETQFNERWAEIIGYQLHELEPTSIDTWLGHAHPEDLEKSGALLEKHWRGESEYYLCEARMRHKRGHWVWVLDTGKVVEWDSSGAPLRMVGTHLDITEDKTSQQLLEESQRRLQNFFDLSSSFMCIANMEGYLETVNQTFVRELGYPEDVLTAQPFLNFVHPDDREDTLNEMERLAKGAQTVSFRNRYHKKNGDYLTLLWNTSPDRSSGKLYATAVDVTQQENDKRDLLRQREMLQSMSRQGRIGAWELNLETGAIFWSAMTKEIHGVADDFTPTLEQGINFYKEGESRETITQVVQDAIETGLPWSVELQIVTTAGNDLWVAATGQPEFRDGKCVRLFGSFQDIDARKRAEQGLQQLNSRLEEQMQLVQAIADAQTSFLEKGNTGQTFDNLLTTLLRLTGSAYGFIGEVLKTDEGQPYLKTHAITNIAWDEQTREFYDTNIEKGLEFYNLNTLFGAAMTSGEPVVSNNPAQDRRSGGLPDGHPPLNAFLGIPIMRNNEQVAMLGLANRRQGYHLDLVEWLTPLLNTIGQLVESLRARRERERAETALRMAKADAEQAAQAKSEFLAIMSHEIRTPLNGVLGMLNLLKRSGLNEEQLHKAAIAGDSAEVLLALINDILDFSKVDAGRLELEDVPFNPHAMLDETLRTHGMRAAEKQLELLLDTTALPERELIGDAGRIRQIFINLIGNAIKFTASGHILVRASCFSQDGQSWFRASVEDTGIGIPEEKQQVLFSPFTQLDASTTRKYGGTGLGLAICKRLCELMGGSIRVSSRPGEGSRFEFDVAIKQGKANKLPEPEHIRTALVLHHNAVARDLLDHSLKTFCNNIATANTLDALDQFDEPDLLLIDQDICGPDFPRDAIEACRAALWDKSRIIMLCNIFADTAALEEAGLNIARIDKPVTDFNLKQSLSGHPPSHVQRRPLPPKAAYLHDGKAHRILLVEDNPVNQEVARMMLADYNTIVDVAGNGLEAMNALNHDENTPPYQLLLMDCQMPEMDGFLATRKIRQGDAGQHYQKVPIVAMTANALKGDRERCIDAGMDDYLSKPVDESALLECLQRWLPNIESLHSDTRTEHSSDSDDTATIWNPTALLHTLKGREDRMAILLRSFTGRMPETLAEFDRARRERDMQALANAVHSVKGSAGQLRAGRLFELATELEKIARLEQTGTPELEVEFRDACEELLAVIDNYHRSRGPID